MKFLSWLGRSSVNATAEAPPPAVETPFCVIGDIHGRLDLLQEILVRLGTYPMAHQMRVICVGDLLDRGPDSAGVLRELYRLRLDPTPFARVLCLRGNHEEMMLQFLNDPLRHGPRWMMAGGEETLLSFGLSPYRQAPGLDPVLVALRDGLVAAVGPELLRWLQDLPLLWREGQWAVTHAGADPRCTLDQQSDHALIWGHRNFTRHPRTDGIWIAHGHVIVPEARIDAGRVAVDTGAYRSNRLSAAVISRDGVELLSVGTSAPDAT